MAIRKRGSTWQIDYFDPAGKRIRINFKKRKNAEAELAKRQSLIAEGRYLDFKKESRVTFGEILKQYAEAFERQRSFKTAKAGFIKKLRSHFGESTKVESIGFAELEAYRNKLVADPVEMTMRNGRKIIKGIRTNAAVNREMSCLRHMFKRAVSWGKIERSPFTVGESLLLKEDNKRLRYLTEEEADRLISASPAYLKPIVLFCLYTGARRQEALSLKWHQIVGEHVHFEKTKTDEARTVPINPELTELLKSLKTSTGTGNVIDMSGDQVDPTGNVFLFRGRAVGDVDAAFKSACKRAGIAYGQKVPMGVTFHTMRHTYASWLAIRGIPIKTIQELLGHKDIKMTMRYAHLSEQVKKDAVKALPSLASFSDCHKSVTRSIAAARNKKPKRR